METPSAQITIQITPGSKPTVPSWMGEVAAFTQVLTHTGILKTIQNELRFARARFGHYDLIDFVAVLIGYALSGEPTLQAFYERLAPWASPFMALFGRDRLPHRSTLSRFLAALDRPPVEALRTLFQKDLFARSPFPRKVRKLFPRFYEPLRRVAIVVMEESSQNIPPLHWTLPGWSFADSGDCRSMP